MTEAFYPANGYKVKVPFWHLPQKRAFDRSCDLPRFALFHWPRVGKSKVIVDTCCYQFQMPTSPLHIRGLIVVVWPAGGHHTWTRDAFPENATVPWRGLAWDSHKWRNRSFKIAFNELCNYSGFSVFAINIEALISEVCREHIGKFASSRKLIMATGDEISSIANSDTRRSRIMMNIGALPFVKMHRILDGTPVDKKGPLDFYAEFGFMGHDILGYPNEVEFQAHYAEIETKGRGTFWTAVKHLENIAKENGYKDPKGWAERTAKKGAIITDPDTKRRRPLLPGRDFWTDIKRDDENQPVFKNMDELYEKIDPITDRCTYLQAFPNWKQPVFAKRYFELTPEQRRVYDEITKEYRALLHDGTEIKAAHHLVRVLRLQQVASNYYPDQKALHLHEACEGIGCEGCDDTGVIEENIPLKAIDPKCNPRMDALREELKLGQPTIVWVRFREDGNQAMAMAEAVGMSPVAYYGAMTGQQKLASWQAFQEKRTAGVIVANWSRGARAIRLDAAEKHIAASNQWSFRTRQQGEQRSEHGSKKFATSFIDIVGIDTVDDQLIIPALRTGMDVSTMVLRDAKRAWI